ncbi:MAG: alpha-ketoglutarate-dependent dioxygenase AlkB [Caulobacterales bacterium]|nr:alpha-ketoglutarate-dependent dioxygenase AlkB [Caulobacterales bacterium]
MSLPQGFRHIPERFDRAAQSALLAEILGAIEACDAPFYVPAMPRTGAPMSVRMTNLGPLGWVTDKDKGYRYEPVHPFTGRPWPAIPDALIALWEEVADYPAPPEACLVNHYTERSKLGLHVDWDEEATDAAVVSLSLGDAAKFRIGGPQRGGPTASMKLSSGDVVVLGGAARHCHHGVDRIFPGTSRLVPMGGRINLTLRRVTKPATASSAPPRSRSSPEGERVFRKSGDRFSGSKARKNKDLKGLP